MLREGILARAADDWDALGDGRRSVRQHGHPVAFGVPRGALLGGRPAPQGNLFVAKWRRVARLFDARRNLVVHQKETPDLRGTLGVEWVQFRLNEAEDDLEILEPVRPLRQRGYEAGPRFCSAPEVGAMNQSFVQAVPLDAACTEWADVNHFDQRRVAALRYRYDPARHRYDWVQTGPFLNGPELPPDRGGAGPRGGRGVGRLGPHRGRHRGGLGAHGRPLRRVAAGDAGGGAAVQRTVHGLPLPGRRPAPVRRRPAALALRPPRDPLYCWEIDPRTFVASAPRVVFDTVAAGLPFRAEATPIADMCKLLPHLGRAQVAAFRVRVRAIDHPYVGVLLNEAERGHSAIYHAELTYDRAYPDAWSFAAG